MKRFVVAGVALALLGSLAYAQNYPNAPRPAPLVGTTALAPVEPASGSTPLMLSLIAPVQVPQATWDVKGLRLNILYGDCREMLGLDLGVAGRSREARALQINVLNMTETLKGLQIGVINYTHTAVGVQIGLVNIIADKDWAFLPIINASF